jgi:hypothetical protein
VISRTIDRSGATSSDDRFAVHQARDSFWVPETGHHVASPFWDFMNSSGLVYEYSFLDRGGQFGEGRLFESPFYASGLPITDAYWSRVQVEGSLRDVLVQCFERRCLTYTPINPPGWQVEAGNVGRHYYRWLYGDDTPPVFPKDDVRIVGVQPGSLDNLPPDDEYIQLRNEGAVALDLDGWVLTDGDGELNYIFPSVQLAPGATLTIYSCNGQDNHMNLYTGECLSAWDWGDYAALYDENGTLVSYYWYSAQ